MQQDQALKIAFSALLTLRCVNRLTGPLVVINIVKVFGLSNVTVPIDGSTVRTDRELLVEW
jgi:hypothetical protein